MSSQLVQQLDSIENRLGKLEVLENDTTSGFVSLQATSPGTAQAGNGNLTGDLRAGGDVYAGDDVIATDDVTAGGDVIASGSLQAGTTITRAGIAMNNVIILDKVCRILDDPTSRASGYANSAVQVSGATDLISGWVTLPGGIKAVWYAAFLITGAAGTSVNLVVENPSFVVGAITLQGATQTVGGITAYSGGGVVSLSALGRLRYVYGGSANVTRTIIDVWAYSL